MPSKSACATTPATQLPATDGPLNNFHDAIRQGIYDWADFDTTPRRVIARRQDGRRIKAEERVAMQAARELQDEGRISIITKPTRDSLGRAIITYIAERVK